MKQINDYSIAVKIMFKPLTSCEVAKHDRESELRLGRLTT